MSHKYTKENDLSADFFEQCNDLPDGVVCFVSSGSAPVRPPMRVCPGTRTSVYKRRLFFPASGILSGNGC
ncbi:hypothetical protein T4E_2328 [Trichinella pseudospiralis]|uniref:Uncharacterized protein n=1 Tax=Trichinella pseudospiralis TaxID=6337 RepID=A0A0V0XIF8_TRIPS|nr:hypothetical protein T4E_2328 [Trichinella pseudospiralis]